jgi:hypothetical protein
VNLRYEDVQFTVYDDSVQDLSVAGSGVETTRGVGIGDDLDVVRAAYPTLRCGRANEGSEYERYEFCTGRVNDRLWIWFGGDPVDSITVARGELYR